MRAETLWILASAAVLTLSPPPSGAAADLVWSGATDHDWSKPGNWLDGGAPAWSKPGATDSVTFNDGGTALPGWETSYLAEDFTVRSLAVQNTNNSHTLNLHMWRTLTVTNGARIGYNVAGSSLFLVGGGDLRVRNGLTVCENTGGYVRRSAALDLTYFEGGLLADQIWVGRNLDSAGGNCSAAEGILRFGSTSDKFRVLAPTGGVVRIGGGRIEVGGFGTLAASNSLKILTTNGRNETGRLAVVSGSTVVVGTPAAPGELVIGERFSTTGADGRSFGSYVAPAGSTNRFYLSTLKIGREETRGAVSGLLDLDQGSHTASVSGSVLIGLRNDATGPSAQDGSAFGALRYGAGSALALGPSNVWIGNGALEIGGQGTLDVGASLQVGRNHFSDFSAALTNRGVLRVGTPVQPAELIVGQDTRVTAAGSRGSGTVSALPGSRTDLRLNRLTVGGSLEGRGDVWGLLDLGGVALVTNAVLNPDEARLVAADVAVGAGTNASRGEIRLGGGTAVVGSLEVGGNFEALTGSLELDGTDLIVTNAARIRASGRVTSRIGADSSGIDLRNPAPASHALTNILVAFTTAPAPGAAKLTGFSMAGSNVTFVGSLTNSGAIAVAYDGLDPLYRVDVWYNPADDATRLGVNLDLRAVNLPPQDLTVNSATLRGYVHSAGGAENPQVFICWGDEDGGTEGTGAWDFVESLGATWDPLEPFSRSVGGLAENTWYYYRCYVTNSAGARWADAAEAFVTAPITLGVLDGEAREYPPDSGTFAVERPAGAAAGMLRVRYRIEGSASNGADYARLDDEVVLADGFTNALITIAPLDDPICNEGDETVTLTLLPGNFVTNAPGGGTVTIRDDDGLTNWAHHTAIAFPGYGQDEVLTNFPALLALHEGIPGFRYADLAATADDLRFTDETAGRMLNYEIETWDTNGTSFVWAQIPALTGGATTVGAHWGNPSAAAPPCRTNGAVWDPGFSAVWHMESRDPRDSTANRRHGSGQGDVTNAAAGAINGACRFDGNDDFVDVAAADLLGMSDDLTVEVWVQPGAPQKSYANVLDHNRDTAPYSNWGLYQYSTTLNQYCLGFAYDATHLDGTGVRSTLSTSEWTALTIVKADTNLVHYVNGVRGASGKVQANVQAASRPFRMGGCVRSAADQDFRGLLDEVRVSSIARSSNWIWTCWANQAAPEAFVAFGPVWPYPMISNTNGTGDITARSANLRGTLLSTGPTPTHVTVYWGLADGGTIATNWAHADSLGVYPTGLVARTITGLSGETTYYYRFFAGNDDGEVWAPSSAVFITLVEGQDFLRKMPIFFSEYERQEILTNFPLGIRLGPHLENFRYGDLASSSGGDLRFVAADGATPLNFEIERWDTNGTSYLWVQVPELSSTGMIWAYWGNPSVTNLPPYTTNGATWDSSYAGVWHLDEGPASGQRHYDSTAYANHGTFIDTNNNSDTAVEGVMDGADLFRGDADSVIISNSPSLNPTNAITISVWGKNHPSRQTWRNADCFVGKRNVYLLGGTANQKDAKFQIYSGGWRAVQFTPPSFDLREWHHYAGTFDVQTGTICLYIDGRLVGTTAWSSTIYGADAGPAYLAYSDLGMQYHEGYLDEVRIASTARSPDWIWACWLNQRPGSTFPRCGAIYPYPGVSNEGGASDVLTHTARIHGYLSSTGAAPTAVRVYWGPADGGTDPQAWAHTNLMGSRDVGPLTVDLSSLTGDTLYYYRFYATNTAGESWAAPAAYFRTSIDPAAFAHRMKIPFPQYNRSEPLTDFPALVVFDESQPFFRYSDFASPSGGDLRFANSNETQTLSYEVEEWNTNGDSWVWVRVPALDGNAYVWAYWGNPGFTVPPEYTTNGATWAAGHVGVWHLAEDRAGTSNTGVYADSTTNRMWGDDYVSATGKTGWIANGQEFDGIGDFVSNATAVCMDAISNAVTVSAWVNLRTNDNYPMMVTKKSGSYYLELRCNAATRRPQFSAGGNTFCTPGAGSELTLGQWYHLTGTFDDNLNEQKLYVNGVLTNQVANNTSMAHAGNPLLFGKRDATYYYDGSLDEVRLEGLVRSSNWIWACWANQAAPKSFAPCGLSWPRPEIETLGADPVLFSSAWPEAMLHATGAAPTEVWVFWGTNDGGTVKGQWEEGQPMGTYGIGKVKGPISGLTDVTTYFYRFYATNSYGDAWADSSGTFRTLLNFDAVRGTNYLGKNMDFEISAGPDRGWYPMGGDQIAFVGGAAYHGFQMLSFSGSDGVDVDAYQMIDLSYYRDAIAQSNVTFETSIMVNFVNTASRDFQLWVRFYEGSTVLPVSSYVRYSVDVDADTWEQVSLPPGVLPPTADHAEFHLRVDAGVTWSGYYMDWAQFILVIPGQPPPPAGPVLIIR